jgi:hypothetical protein
MGKWFCIWDDLANPKIGLNLVPNRLKRGEVGGYITEKKHIRIAMSSLLITL